MQSSGGGFQQYKVCRNKDYIWQKTPGDVYTMPENILYLGGG